MRALASTLKESSAVAAVRGRHAFSVRRLGSYSSSSAAHRQSSHDSDEKPHYDAKRRKKKAYYILGPDLPDIWPPLHPNPCALSAPQPRGCDELIPKIIDGKSIARDIRLGIAEEVRYMKETVEKVPGLAVVLVGQRRDSQSYVRFKIKACQEVGIRSLIAELREDCNENEVINAVSSFNTDPSIHGISLEKDVDGFHPLNMGNLALRGREPLFIPCAAKSCIELLLRFGVELKGKHVAVIGRSNIVGLPTSLLLQRHHATVSIVHAFTNNPQDITSKADIVISAAGVADVVRGSWLKRGAVVIDVGTNPIDDPSTDYGYYLKGDVCYEEALQVVSAITPVPGGVGPVTIAMLLSNTLDSAKQAYGLS